VSDSSGISTREFLLNVQPVGGFVGDPDLVLHYTFDEGGGTQIWDSATGGNNHSTNVPAAHWVNDGRFGGAYGPGDASATLNRFFPVNQNDLNFLPRGDPFTISVWVRSHFVGGYRTVIGKDDGVVSGYAQMRLWTTNTMTNVQGVNGGQYGGQLVTAPALNDGQWHMITMVNYNDAGTWRTRIYYDDGTQFIQFNTGPGGTTPGLLRIGDTTLGGNAWNGQLDDLRIYRRALSQAEINALYGAPDVESFDDWRNAHLTPTQLANPALNTAAADANGNGIANAIEFAVGSSSMRPLNLQVIDGNAQLSLTRNSLARGIILIIECTTDFVTWLPLATSINGAAPTGSATIIEGSGVLRTLQVSSPAGIVPTFYRVRVEMP